MTFRSAPPINVPPPTSAARKPLRWHLARNDIQIGITGFGQRDDEAFNVLFNDGSNAPVNQVLRPTGSLVAAYLEDTYKPTDWLQFAGGVRQTHFTGDITENATSPRLGVSRSACRGSAGSCAASGASTIRRRRSPR